jgi:hypothetical protein
VESNSANRIATKRRWNCVAVLILAAGSVEFEWARVNDTQDRLVNPIEK